MEIPINASEPQSDKVEQLLAGASAVRSGCDLDLLIFLYRHPRSLLTAEQIVTFVGHPMAQVAQSLDVFITSGLLARTPNPSHAARLYLLTLGGPEGDRLKALLEFASTRAGRQSVIEVLRMGAEPLADRSSHSRRRLRTLRIA